MAMRGILTKKTMLELKAENHVIYRVIQRYGVSGGLVAGISAMTSLLIYGNLNERERQKIAQAVNAVVKKVEDKLKITDENLEATNEDVEDLKHRVRILEQGRVAVDKPKSVEFAQFAMQRLTGSTSNSSSSPARFPSTPTPRFPSPAARFPSSSSNSSSPPWWFPSPSLSSAWRFPSTRI